MAQLPRWTIIAIQGMGLIGFSIMTVKFGYAVVSTINSPTFTSSWMNTFWSHYSIPSTSTKTLFNKMDETIFSQNVKIRSLMMMKLPPTSSAISTDRLRIMEKFIMTHECGVPLEASEALAIENIKNSRELLSQLDKPIRVIKNYR